MVTEIEFFDLISLAQITNSAFMYIDCDSFIDQRSVCHFQLVKFHAESIVYNKDLFPKDGDYIIETLRIKKAPKTYQL